MRHTLPGLVTTAASLALLAACASGIPHHQEEQQVRDRYASYAGPPIQSFTWLGRYDGWEALGKDELVLFTNPSQAYLLKVWPPCDLRFVINRIGLTATGSTVYSGLDSVIVDSSATGRWRCPISEIRPIDYKRMRADMRAQAQAQKAAAQQQKAAQ
jgi:hypothetical protein